MVFGTLKFVHYSRGERAQYRLPLLCISIPPVTFISGSVTAYRTRSMVIPARPRVKARRLPMLKRCFLREPTFWRELSPPSCKNQKWHDV